MGKHAHQGAMPGSAAPADPVVVGDGPMPSDQPPSSSTDQPTASSGGMMKPNPYWGPHDEKA